MPPEPSNRRRAQDPGRASAAASVAEALRSARQAQVEWRRWSLASRLRCVRALRRVLVSDAAILASASADARGRPPLESLVAEVFPLVEACRFLEREATRVLAPRRVGRWGRPFWLGGVRSRVHRDPLGVVLILGPSNYPLFLPGVQAVQALVAGNAVLLKPGAGGRAAAGALALRVEQAGFPRGLLRVLSESADDGREGIAAGVDLVVLTGRAETGVNVLAQCAPRLVPALVELSGADAVIVRADADLDRSTRALAWAVGFNGGATCIAPRRVLVHRSVATEFEGRLEQRFQEIPPRRLSAAEASGLDAWVREALDQGAHWIAGGLCPDGTVMGPVVLGGVDPRAALLRADLFAPVLAVLTVETDLEAVARVHESEYALGAALFTRNEAVARTLAQQLRVGMVVVNDLIAPTADPRVPFGGRKRSGFGVTRGPEGLLALTTPRVVMVQRGRRLPQLDPVAPGDFALLAAVLRGLHGGTWRSRMGAVFTVVKALWARQRWARQQRAALARPRERT